MELRVQLVIVFILTNFGSQCQMAPASAGQVKQFEIGSANNYKLTSTVLLNEPGSKGKDVGYQISGEIKVSVIWQNPQSKNDKLLHIQIKSPELHIKSRKAPEPEGFVPHSSEINKLSDSPYLVHWNSGIVEHVFINKDEEISILNFKKGIASLFQFQVIDSETKETDSSGKCKVIYSSTDLQAFTKTKTDCISNENIPYLKHPEETLSTNVTSKRSAKYLLTKDLSTLQSVTTEESHVLILNVKKDAGSSISATQELILSGPNNDVISILTQDNIEAAVKEFENTVSASLVQQSLHLDVFKVNCEVEECQTLPKLVKENRDILAQDHLGTVKSASVFIKLLSAARDASKEELTKSFKGTRNKEILSQLCDLAGSIQTLESHHVMMKLINFDLDEDQEESERYLWALAQGSHPHEEVLQDIYKISQKPHNNEKVSETLLLTVAAMANRFQKQPGNENHKLINSILQSLLGGLETCKDENCKQKYFRVFKNLKHPKTIPVLLKHALTGKKKTNVGAMACLRSFEPKYWDSQVVDVAQRIFYQAGRKYDSSARTLAVDILLESEPSYEVLKELIFTLTLDDPVYEVKQYLNQRIKQIADNNIHFASKVTKIYKEYFQLFNNYNMKALRGLTTAFTRRFMTSPSVNGSISTVQEISSGLLKRGVVEILLDTKTSSHTLFSLGLFAGGLGSFISSNKENDVNANEIDKDDEEEEPATAGMEVNVAGVQIRPFVFFSGQGELMGHVWSGTASEKTPAYQSFILLQDHLEFISLQNGIVAKLQVHGIVSFDLSAQIQMSIWNRNAHTLVEINSGTALQGKIQADTSFVRSQVEYNVGAEGKIDLVSDINFYGDVSLCMQVSQPDTVVKHHVHKIERIPGSKHRLRKSKYKSFTVPGRTFVLNQKNNEMCNKIFPQSS